MKAQSKIISVLLLTISLTLLMPSCAINPVTGKKEIMFMSEQQEVAMGQQYDPSVISTFGVYKNDALLKLIEEKGTEMAKISHRPNIKYHFRILDSPVINAFAVPGGYLYFTRGILAQFNNEAELMGVLGHEMGHVTARHSVKQQTRQQIGQMGLLVGMLASKKVAEFADMAMKGMQLLFLSFSRSHETEADRLGVEYASKIGYDTHKMADFFNVLHKMSMGKNQARVPTWMSTHPDPGDRYVATNNLTKEWQAKLPGKTFAINSERYLQMIDGIVYGEDPRQGFVENNIFYHPELKFQFSIPTSWKLVNAPTQVQMLAPDKKATIVFALAKEKTAEQAAKQALTNFKLNLIESKEERVNGYKALATLSQQVSQNQQTGQQQSIKVLSYFIEKGEGMIYTFHGVSSSELFNNKFETFKRTMSSFTRLTDSSKLSIKPDRIRIKKVQRTGSLASAFNYYNIPQSKHQKLALLNNLSLEATVNRGQLIKTIGK